MVDNADSANFKEYTANILEVVDAVKITKLAKMAPITHHPPPHNTNSSQAIPPVRPTGVPSFEHPLDRVSESFGDPSICNG